MNGDDRISGGVLMALAIATCLASIRLSLGSFNSPKAGFFPFIMALVIGILSLVLFLKEVFSRNKRPRSLPLLRARLGQKKVWCILLALVAYGLLLEHLGFLLTVFLAFAFILRAVEPQRWWVCLAGGLVASIGSYSLFYLALGVQLPRGFWGM